LATQALSSYVQSAVSEYALFWQLWPQFEQTNGERRLLGLEVELVGSHTSNLDHFDPACPMCHHVRSILVRIADLMIRDAVLSRYPLYYNIDSHSNSILCLPSLGSRPGVSINVSWSRTASQKFETDLPSENQETPSQMRDSSALVLAPLRRVPVQVCSDGEKVLPRCR